MLLNHLKRKKVNYRNGEKRSAENNRKPFTKLYRSFNKCIRYGHPTCCKEKNRNCCLPKSKCSLGVGIPKIARMLTYGCCIGIGTDNVMINSPDMFRELDYIWSLTRALEDKPIPAREILKMATVNGARILGINSGAIITGNLQMCFYQKNNLDISPMYDPHTSIVHRANPNSILNVMIDGKFDGDII